MPERQNRCGSQKPVTPSAIEGPAFLAILAFLAFLAFSLGLPNDRPGSLDVILLRRLLIPSRMLAGGILAVGVGSDGVEHTLRRDTLAFGGHREDDDAILDLQPDGRTFRLVRCGNSHPA